VRLNPLHLRIGLLVLNLVAAVGVPAYAALRFWKMGDDVGSIDLADPADLVFREGETAAVMGRGPSQLIAVAGWVMPSRQAAEAPGAGELTPDASTVERPPEDPKELQPGPLAIEPHNLEYYWSIVRKDDPQGNQVALRKKDAAAGAGGPGAVASTRTTVRRTTTSQRPARVSVGGRKQLGGQPSDAVSFFVRDRRYTDKERNLDFMIHSADEKQFVYWMPEDPKKMYALQKVSDSLYYTDKEKGLRPPEKTAEDLAAEEEETKHFIFLDTRNPNAREEEYQEMLKGKPGGPLLSPKKSAEGKAQVPGASEGAGASPSRPVPSFGRKNTGTPPRTVMTDDEKQQLREALQSPKMTPKDREELQKALRGAPGVK
jgi:hypothetical protein